MPRKTKSLVLRDGDYEYLHSLIKQRTIQAQVVIVHISFWIVIMAILFEQLQPYTI